MVGVSILGATGGTFLYQATQAEDPIESCNLATKGAICETGAFCLGYALLFRQGKNNTIQATIDTAINTEGCPIGLRMES